MIYCESCGASNEDGTKFCYQCGAPISAAPTHTQQETAGGNGNANNTISSIANNYLAQALVDPTEKVVATLGNGYIVNMMYASLRSVNAILTDRRVYLQGVFFQGVGNKFIKTNQEQVVDVRDITGTCFIFTRNLGILVWAWICLIVSILAGSIVGIAYYFDTGLVLMGLGLIPAIVLFVIYFLSRTTLFCIEYAGGSISFDASIIGIPTVRAFHKQIRMVKDRHMDILEGRIS